MQRSPESSGVYYGPRFGFIPVSSRRLPIPHLTLCHHELPCETEGLGGTKIVVYEGRWRMDRSYLGGIHTPYGCIWGWWATYSIILSSPLDSYHWKSCPYNPSNYWSRRLPPWQHAADLRVPAKRVGMCHRRGSRDGWLPGGSKGPSEPG